MLIVCPGGVGGGVQAQAQQKQAEMRRLMDEANNCEREVQQGRQQLQQLQYTAAERDNGAC
jgi:hypothetical protein